MLDSQRRDLLKAMAPTERRESIIAEQGREIANLKRALLDSRKNTLEEAMRRLDLRAKEGEPSLEDLSWFGFGSALAFTIAKDELNAMAKGQPYKTIDQQYEELVALMRKKQAQTKGQDSSWPQSRQKPSNQ